MSADTESSAAAPRIVGEDGLTNKERRLAKQAEKRKRAEEGVKEERIADTPVEVAPIVATEDVEDEEEVEAISHKEKRKRRKLEKKGLLPPAAGDEAAEEQREFSTSTGANAATALPPRSSHALWVGNMNFMTSPERLQEWFEQKGISGISRVHMPKGMKKFEQNKGCVCGVVVRRY